jgi:ATP-binding cassette subfamily B protein
MIQAIILGIILFRTEWHMALLMFAFMPFIFLVAWGFRAMARRVTKRGMRAMADVNAAIKETVSGISIAKNFRQEESIFETFDFSNQQSYRVNIQRGFVLSLVFPTLNALGGIFTAIWCMLAG